jgi:biopolymer transport protein TolQ
MSGLGFYTALAAGGDKLNFIELIKHATAVGKGVLILLALFSLLSWAIIIYKSIAIMLARRTSDRFLNVFWESRRLDEVYDLSQRSKRSPVAQVFGAGYVELSRIKNQAKDSSTGWLGDMQSIERSLGRARTNELTRLENLLPFLATTGSAAPFIGLFGTVWGIMESFRNIGAKGAANLATVAPGIAEALIATAVGLAAAIPAVMAYNFFLRKVKVLHVEMDSFANDFLNIIKRHFFK